MEDVGIPLRNKTAWKLYNGYMYQVVRKHKPETFVESGVAGGQTSYVILEAMRKNGRGHLYSFDPGHEHCDDSNIEDSYEDPSFREKEPGANIPDHLKDRWTYTKDFFVDSARDVLSGLEGEVDMFFHDSDHSFENINAEFDLMEDFVNRTGFFMIHDEPSPKVWKTYDLAFAVKRDGGILKHGLKVFIRKEAQL